MDKVLFVNPAGACTVHAATEETRYAARYTMCSQVAWYAFAYSWGWSAMEVSGMYFDRRWREPNPLPFYLNVLSTDFLNFGSIRQANRTLSFLWAKRHEIFNRVWGRIPRNPSATAGELDQRTSRASLPPSRLRSLTAMKLEWINHASFVIRSGDIRLITDPWAQTLWQLTDGIRRSRVETHGLTFESFGSLLTTARVIQSISRFPGITWSNVAGASVS